MAKNIIEFTLTITDESALRLLKRTPSLYSCFAKNELDRLKVGDNTLRMGHYAYSTVNRMFGGSNFNEAPQYYVTRTNKDEEKSKTMS